MKNFTRILAVLATAFTVLVTAAPASAAPTAAGIAPDCHNPVARPVKDPAASAAAIRAGFACPPAGLKSWQLRTSSTVEAWDSTDPWALPNFANFNAGYMDGAYRSFGGIRARLPGSTTVGITVGFTSYTQSVRAFDSEPGNPDPNAAAAWAQSQINNTSNKRPIVYTMASWWPWLQQALAARGIPHCSSNTQTHCVLYWIASWSFHPGNIPGADGTQWTDSSYGNNDESTNDYPGFYTDGGTQVNAASFNSGFNIGYATGRSVAYKRGYVITHSTPTPVSAGDFNTGYSKGWSAGWHYSARTGNTAGGAAPVRPATYNGSFNLGFDKCWAGAAGLGVGTPYWNYFALYNHGAPSNWTAYYSGCYLGRPKAYNHEFDAGY